MGTEHTGFPDKRSDPAGVAGGQRDSGDDDLLLHSGSGDHQCADSGIRRSDH